MKLNSEDADPQTKDALDILSTCDQHAETLLATSAVLASFNGRKFVEAVKDKVRHLEKPADRPSMLRLTEEIMQSLSPDFWFTNSFDLRACNRSFVAPMPIKIYP